MSMLGLVGAFLFGVLSGAVGMYLWRLRGDESGELRRKLADEQARSASFHAEVDEHFTRTSDLFQEVTQKYRSLHDHLAQGATGLTSRPQQLPAGDIPERTLLDSAADTATAEPPVVPPPADDAVPPAAAQDDGAGRKAPRG